MSLFIYFYEKYTCSLFSILIKLFIKHLLFKRKERAALLIFLYLLVCVKLVFSFLHKRSTLVQYEFPETSQNNQSMRLPGKISAEEVESSIGSFRTKTSNDFAFDINLVDSLRLKKLPGVGVVYASRIVRYRKLLGGFYAKEQLLEVYGIDSVLYNKILPYLFIEKKSLRKLNVNESSIKDFNAHPYISYSVARLIVRYRKHHGDYESLEELKRLPLVDEQLFRKIVLYLKLE
jgi:DNA uptake protein ComE-like DNA-binding protein